jgi:hypothetical protein
MTRAKGKAQKLTVELSEVNNAPLNGWDCDGGDFVDNEWVSCSRPADRALYGIFQRETEEQFIMNVCAQTKVKVGDDLGGVVVTRIEALRPKAGK